MQRKTLRNALLVAVAAASVGCGMARAETITMFGQSMELDGLSEAERAHILRIYELSNGGDASVDPNTITAGLREDERRNAMLPSASRPIASPTPDSCDEACAEQIRRRSMEGTAMIGMSVQPMTSF